MKAYCEMFGVDGEERWEFVELIRALDDEYLRHQAEKSKQARKGKGG